MSLCTAWCADREGRRNYRAVTPALERPERAPRGGQRQRARRGQWLMAESRAAGSEPPGFSGQPLRGVHVTQCATSTLLELGVAGVSMNRDPRDLGDTLTIRTAHILDTSAFGVGDLTSRIFY